MLVEPALGNFIGEQSLYIVKKQNMNIYLNEESIVRYKTI